MEDRTGKKWSREETILAFELYCRTPFSKISKTNEDIINLAMLLGRSPSSVGLKMANLAHYDPEIRKKNLAGMSHGSKLDAEICMEFAGNWEMLSFEAEEILAREKGVSLEKMLGIEEEFSDIPLGKYRNTKMKQRVGQYFFRTAILNSYANRCCITGINEPKLLIASHIKPWKVSDEKTERTNPRNGLCLNALHDKAFDKGLITLNNNYEIIISSQFKKADMDQTTKDWFMMYDHKEIIRPDKFLPDRKFIEYHNDVIFQK
ncbi:HNH endonuclease [Dorea longicatena]|uniref:HNH endonuclease n=1 Tax=Dorea longicatena TaxID=88431 RepID=UPI00156D5531|nr:HNH endonuclease [Dorea longicatena]NSC57336.1 HNH endonuclease [Dorea longicatena]NSD09688.1 HNH endonuclease [Dorea longicatena]NSF13098.1 HNH endonuclease [Dorea longicatena]